MNIVDDIKKTTKKPLCQYNIKKLNKETSNDSNQEIWKQILR